MDHPLIRNANDVHNERLSPIERFCKRVADSTGAPIALALVIVAQLVWIGIGQFSQKDPYPFVFLLTISNVIQLTLLFVISVAQRQSSEHAEVRAELDHQWIGALLRHQELQEQLLLQLAETNNLTTADVRQQLAAIR